MLGNAQSGLRAQAADAARDQTQTLVLAELLARTGQELHPEADTEDRLAGGCMGADRFDQALLPQRRHAVAEGADTRQQQRCGGRHLGRIAGRLGLGADALQGGQHRADVGEAAIDDGDHDATRSGGRRSISARVSSTSPLASKRCR